MIYIIVTIFIYVTIMAITGHLSDTIEFVGISILFSIFLCIFCVFQYDAVDITKTNYVVYKYVYDEPQTYKLEALPESKNKHISYIESNAENGYRYCIKDKDGTYIQKNTSKGSFAETKIIYTDDVQPSLQIEKGKKVFVLTQKPSFWFNFYKWFQVKNYDIGDTVYEYPLPDDKYTFYLPYQAN